MQQPLIVLHGRIDLDICLRICPLVIDLEAKLTPGRIVRSIQMRPQVPLSHHARGIPPALQLGLEIHAVGLHVHIDILDAKGIAHGEMLQEFSRCVPAGITAGEQRVPGG